MICVRFVCHVKKFVRVLSKYKAQDQRVQNVPNVSIYLGFDLYIGASELTTDARAQTRISL